MRKWASNHPTLLDTIPTELQQTQRTLSLDKEDGVTTHGLLWNPTTDQLQVKNTIQVQLTDSTASKKRRVLATTASIFDPLGLLSPAVIAYKIFLQKLLQDKQQWDELLPAHLQQEWNQLLHAIPKLSQIKINRLSAPMLPTFKYMDSATAVNEPTKPASTFAPQTATRTHIVNFCAPYQRCHN